jgi:hypothetical protein
VEGLKPGTEAKVVMISSPDSLPSAQNSSPPDQQQCWINITSWINSRGPAKGSIAPTTPDWGWYSTGFTRYFRLNVNHLPRARAFVVWRDEAAPRTVESPDLDLDPAEDRQAFIFKELEVEEFPEGKAATKER